METLDNLKYSGGAALMEISSVRESGRLRRILLRIAVALALLLGAASVRPAKAQFAVTDFTQIAANYKSSLAELAQLLKEVGVNIDQLEWLDTIMDLAGEIQDLLDDIGLFMDMYKSLAFQAKVMKYYLVVLKDMEAYGFRASMIQEIKSRISYGYNTVKDMIAQALKILQDTGLSKADKVRMAQEYAAKVKNESVNRIMLIQDAVNTATEAQALIEFDNFILGLPAKENIEKVTLGINTLEDLDEDKKVSEEDALGEDYDKFRAINRHGIAIFYTVLAILLLFALVLTTVRFMRGDPRSETGFFRILVVIVVSAVVFTVLSGVLKI